MDSLQKKAPFPLQKQHKTLTSSKISTSSGSEKVLVLYGPSYHNSDSIPCVDSASRSRKSQNVLSCTIFEVSLIWKNCTKFENLVSPINYIYVLLILDEICWTLHSDQFLNSQLGGFCFSNFLRLLMNWKFLEYFHRVATRRKRRL